MLDAGPQIVCSKPYRCRLVLESVTSSIMHWSSLRPPRTSCLARTPCSYLESVQEANAKP